MKITEITFLLTAAILLCTGCEKATTKKTAAITSKINSVPVKKPIAAENLQTASFTIKGMTCAYGCAKTIEKELSDLDGVQKASVDFDKKTALVIFDKTIQNPKTLTNLVQKSGDGKTYKVSNLQ